MAVGWESSGWARKSQVKEGLGYFQSNLLCQNGSPVSNTKATPLTHLGVSHLRD